MRLGRLVLYSLPLSTVVVIAFALFVVGAPRAYHGVRLHGGPTEGASRLSLRLSAVERYTEVEAPARLDDLVVTARLEDGRAASARVATDELGTANVALDLGGPIRGPVAVGVTSARGVLARGNLSLAPERWLERLRERGGVLPGQSSGALVVRAVPARGAFAIPFGDPLSIEVSRAGGPVVGARVSVELEGATLAGDARPTDARGRTSVTLAPVDHIASVILRAATDAGETGTFTGALPIAVGALRATRQDDQLRVDCAIERELAYFAVITERERLLGGVVTLSPNGRGGSVGLAPLPPLPPGPVWAVVSGEPELDSASTVGWPIAGPSDGEPPKARAVPDRLLLDGLTLGFAAETKRRQEARHVALGFTLLAGLLAAALLVREGQRSACELDEHLKAAGAEPSQRQEQAKKRWLGLIVAVLCVGMGFAVLLLVAMYRMG
ncbi:MAG: hypothetical protein HYZ29_02650 [Myxococcales bacterium]|nr:hypothetical protein [Myxococcales bacterium]